MRYVIFILCCMLLSSCAMGGRGEQTGTTDRVEDKTAATGGGAEGGEETNKPYPEVEDETGKSYPLELGDVNVEDAD